MGDDETHLHVTYASHFDMDEAFCARMHAAIAAGHEKALIGVITTPGTQNPKYLSDPTARYVRQRNEWCAKPNTSTKA
jgi:hypothetical protein